jgi:hypothetical protein
MEQLMKFPKSEWEDYKKELEEYGRSSTSRFFQEKG